MPILAWHIQLNPIDSNMCTLSYIPLPSGGFLLTSNRDERVAREPALPPAIYLHNDLQLMYPRDPQGGGTWIVAASNQFTLCLLNGAFAKHRADPPYVKSRGLVVTQFFDYRTVPYFMEQYNFVGIEPFTLVIIDHHAAVRIDEIRWDGKTVFHQQIETTKPRIWSSVTLYEPAVIAEREQWFVDFLKQTPEPQLHDLLHFHHFGGKGDSQTAILMNRENVLKTVSVTAVKVCKKESYMLYEETGTETFFSCNLPHAV
jgi:hypothetical protein